MRIRLRVDLHPPCNPGLGQRGGGNVREGLVPIALRHTGRAQLLCRQHPSLRRPGGQLACGQRQRVLVTRDQVQRGADLVRIGGRAVATCAQMHLRVQQCRADQRLDQQAVPPARFVAGVCRQRPGQADERAVVQVGCRAGRSGFRQPDPVQEGDALQRTAIVEPGGNVVHAPFGPSGMLHQQPPQQRRTGAVGQLRQLRLQCLTRGLHRPVARTRVIQPCHKRRKPDLAQSALQHPAGHHRLLRQRRRDRVGDAAVPVQCVQQGARRRLERGGTGHQVPRLTGGERGVERFEQRQSAVAQEAVEVQRRQRYVAGEHG